MATDASRQAIVRPLYVDLDGTLVATDLLWESIFKLAHAQPLGLLRALAASRGRRAAFKAALADHVVPDPRTLPYRSEVLAYLESQRAAGRPVVLATATHQRLAGAVATHLGLFDDVLATDGTTNVKGDEKRLAIAEHAGGVPFEYMGDAAADLPIWREAARATLVAASPRVRRAAERASQDVQVLVVRTGVAGAAVRALRPHQWVKNALLFAPLLLAHAVGDLGKATAVILAFLSFCLVASATYVLNDLLDVEADRRHPRKRERPFASGALPVATGPVLILLLFAAGFGLSIAFGSPAATAMLAVYAALTTAYSFAFKERLFLDVLVLAALYTHRVLAGGVAAQVEVSPWLLAFSMFFFLGLALVKRYIELLGAEARNQEQLERRGYEVGDIGLVQTMGLVSGYLSVLVLCLYVTSSDVRLLYSTPEWLWLMCPIMLFWITRVWFLARRGLVADDPVLFAATDGASYLAAAAIAGVALLAATL